MDRRFSSLVILLVLPAWGGCISTEETDLFRVEFPDQGAWVSYKVTIGNNIGYQNLSVESRERITRGDGTVVDAVAVSYPSHGGKSIYFVDVYSRDLVKRTLTAGFPYEEFRLNHGDSLLGNHFWGMDLRAGENWSKPFRTPRYMMQIAILEATTDGAIAVVHHPQRVPSVTPAPIDEGNSYVYVWKGSRLFPNEIRIVAHYGTAGEEELSRVTLIEQRSHTARIVPPYEPIVYPFEPVSWDRFPPMDGVEAHMPYREFVERVIADPDASSFLNAHPRAYAAFLSHQLVREERSTSSFWYVVLRDETSQGFAMSMVRRCFAEDALRLVYGECRDEASYLGGRAGKGPIEVKEVVRDSWRKPDTNSLAAAMESVQKVVPDLQLAGVIWFAYPMHGRDGRNANAGDPGWMILDGEIVGNVDYFTPEGGPRAWGIAENASDIPVDGTRWVINRVLT